MKFLLFIFTPFMEGYNEYNLTIVKNMDIVDGDFVDQVLPPNQVSKVMATVICHQMEDCNHFFKNDTGIYFLSLYTKLKEGTGTLYHMNRKLV